MSMGARCGEGKPGVGIIGAGGFAQETLLPALSAHVAAGCVRLTGVVTGRSETARTAAGRWGFAFAGAGHEGTRRLLEDRDTRAVLVATRHDSHAEITATGLRAGRHVFVEKPLAITAPQLALVEAALAASARAAESTRGSAEVGEGPPFLHTNFNRRFAPLAAPLLERLRARKGPYQVSITVNARPIPWSHWRQDRSIGGGRFLGHALHYLDLARFLIGERLVTTSAVSLDRPPKGHDPENLVVSLQFRDGSLAVLQYCPAGDPAQLGEMIWVSGAGLTAWVNNWAAAEVWEEGQVVLRRSLRSPDKGFAGSLAAFLEAIRARKDGANDPPIPVGEQLEVAHAGLEIAEALRGW